jgi:hypothetical protein
MQPALLPQLGQLPGLFSKLLLHLIDFAQLLRLTCRLPFQLLRFVEPHSSCIPFRFEN